MLYDNVLQAIEFVTPGKNKRLQKEDEMIIVKCDKCNKQFEVFMIRCEEAIINLDGMSFEQVVTLSIPKEVMYSLIRKGSGETLCTTCSEDSTL